MSSTNSEWEKFHDEDTGQDYWHNTKTGESTWDDPEEQKNAPSKEEIDVHLAELSEQCIHRLWYRPYAILKPFDKDAANSSLAKAAAIARTRKTRAHGRHLRDVSLRSSKEWCLGTLLSVDRETYSEGNVQQGDYPEDAIALRVEDEDLAAVGGKRVVFLSPEDTRQFHISHKEGLHDITLMNELNEAAVLHSLESRFLKDEIYTYASKTLISINPYRMLDIYSMDETKRNDDKIQSSLTNHGDDIDADTKTQTNHEAEENIKDHLLYRGKPHVYCVADRAYDNLINADANVASTISQSILVNGESGAGKTEASKLLMRRLVHFSSASRSDENTSSSSQATTSNLEHLILRSNVILEAFGNAKTIRNDNSSRFGKYIQIFYDGLEDGESNAVICGATTRHFLLEKSRIVHRASNERNYHILYQLTTALSDCDSTKASGFTEDKDLIDEIASISADLNVQPSHSYAYLSGSDHQDSIGIPGVDDNAEFYDTFSALKELGVDKDQRRGLCEALLCVAELGDITFTAASDGNEEKAEVENKDMITGLAARVGVDGEKLQVALQQRIMRAHGVETVIPFTVDQAKDCRDGLAKQIYSNIFDWVNEHINEATDSSSELGTRDKVSKKPFIGILDIFGFEILQHNSFEQLCINFANEILQSIYNEDIFVLEQKFYRKQGIDWKNLKYHDNSALLELLTAKKPAGVFTILNEQSILGGTLASDEHFLNKINLAYAGKPGKKSGDLREGQHENFDVSPKMPTSFLIKHYAGTVAYDSIGFISKNNDALHHELVELFETSQNKFVSQIMSQDQLKKLAGMAASASGGTGSMAKSASPRRATKMLGTMTVSAIFIAQMTELQTILRATSLHFIRCVKPNEQKAARVLNGRSVAHQLRFLGVLETVRIRREGYPVRESFDDFWSRYKVLLRENAESRKFAEDVQKSKDYKAGCEHILAEILGQDKVDENDLPLWQVGNTLVFLKDGQLSIIDQAVRDLYDRAMTRIQGQARMKFARRMLERKKRKKAATKLQSLHRGRQGRKAAKKVLMKAQNDAASKLQRQQRAHAERLHFLKMKEAAIVLEAKSRGWIQRKHYGETRRAVIKMESVMREMKARKEFLEKKAAAVKLESVFRKDKARKEFLAEKQAAIKIENIARMKHDRDQFKEKKNAAIKIERKMKEHLHNKHEWQFKNATATKLEAFIRQHLERERFLMHLRRRDEYAKYLKTNEAIVLASIVRKHHIENYLIAAAKVGKLRRMLLYTTHQRILYIDMNRKSLRGIIDMSKCRVVEKDTEKSENTEKKEEEEEEEAQALEENFKGRQMVGQEFCIVGEKDFSIKCISNAGGKSVERTYFFHDILGKSARWEAALTCGQISMINIMKPSARLRRAVSVSVTVQGTLLKKPHGFNMFGWNKRFFALHHANLIWFRSRKDKIPKGQIAITAEAVIRELPEQKKKFPFELWAPAYAKGLTLQCLSASERRRWMNALKRAQRNSKENGLLFFDEADEEGRAKWQKVIDSLEEKAK